MTRYDANGNEYEPEDVLSPEELDNHRKARAERGRPSWRAIQEARRRSA